MFLDGLLWISLALAALPAAMVAVNLLVLWPPRQNSTGETPSVSVLIPARDEQAVIAGAVEAALASQGVTLEVVVLDDGSTDDTAAVVRDIQNRDERVKLVDAPPLPDGWCGKQHACARLAEKARYPWLLFQDADVTLAPDAARSLVDTAASKNLDLLSGFPRQETVSFGEKLIVPLIHFVLLGFLPLPAARLSSHPAFAAGCGQLMLARRSAYEGSGGHSMIRFSRHDGLNLPRSFRAQGYRTDLTDATFHARCRMYHSLPEVWTGFAKNADEGMASPGAIVPWTLLLGGGQVLPFVLAVVFAVTAHPKLSLALVACGLSLVTRLVLTIRFRQSWIGALFHPVGVLGVLLIQWYALVSRFRGRPILWKGRARV